MVTHESILVGDVEVGVVCEGYAPLELAEEMPGAGVDWADERRLHPWAFHDDRSWAWAVHAFALRSPSGVVMVDTGVGEFPPFRPWVERSDPDAALAELGIDPGDVRAVVHTHLHADHAGGAVRAGGPRFPNAVHHVHPADWAFFEGANDPEDYTARGAMGVLEERVMLDLSEEDREVASGIRVVHAPGHTPGHRVVILRSGEETLLLTGDLLHLPAQVARPEVRSSHDEDAETGCRSRIGVLDGARSGGWLVAVGHFAIPFGRVEPEGWRSEG